MDLSKFESEKFSIKPYIRRIDKPWGYELHFVPEGLTYMGKILHINGGKRLSLQVHDKKQESYYLLNGECNLILEDSNHVLQTVEMEKGKGYTIVIGQKHRHQAVSDCDILEVSSPETGTTWRLEDDFKRPDETPVQRKIERSEK